MLFSFFFFKFILACVLLELLWPTHYFNRKHNYNAKFETSRDYISIFLKLRGKNKTYKMYSLELFKYFFKKA